MKGKAIKNRSKDKKIFARTANRTRAINLYGTTMRGGIRL